MEQLENTNHQSANSKRHSNNISLILLGSVLISSLFVLCTSCSSPKISGGSLDSVFIDAQSKFIVFLPFVVCKDMQSEDLISAPDFNSEAIEVYLKQLAEKAIADKGCRLIAISDDYSDTILSEDIVQDAFRDSFNNNTLQFLKQTYQQYGNVLAIFMTVDVLFGPVEDVDPLTSKVKWRNKTIIKTKVIDIQTSTSLWENIVQIREIPNLNNANLEKAIKLIFSTLKVRKEGL